MWYIAVKCNNPDISSNGLKIWECYMALIISVTTCLEPTI